MIADLQLLRDLGCNFIRGSHYQQDPRFLDLCDEMGFLVFEESLGWGQQVRHFTDPEFIAAQVAQTAAMIDTGYNHPSVILRGFLNEGESHKEESGNCYRALIGLVRKKDPFRLVAYATNRGLKDRWLELIDVICFNIYPGWYAENCDDESPLGEIVPRIRRELDGLKQRGLSDKPFIISEIGAGALYGWRDPACAYWSEEYQREYLRLACREAADNPAVAGVALWQFCDGRTYRGARALGRPRAFNNKGTLDEYRRPKLAYDTVKEIFNGVKKYA
jgi:beta-glucuronidase